MIFADFFRIYHLHRFYFKLIDIHSKKIFDIYILKKSKICVLFNYIISLRMLMMNNKFETCTFQELLHCVKKTSATKENLIHTTDLKVYLTGMRRLEIVSLISATAVLIP